MLKFRGRRLLLVGGLVIAAVFAVVFAAGALDDDGSDRRRTTLEDLSEADLDRIVVQVQDPRFDRLSPSVVDDYRDSVVLAGDDPRGSREPLAVLRSDDGDGSIWDNELLIGGAGVAFVAALFLTWRALRLRRERRS